MQPKSEVTEGETSEDSEASGRFRMSESARESVKVVAQRAPRPAPQQAPARTTTEPMMKAVMVRSPLASSSGVRRRSGESAAVDFAPASPARIAADQAGPTSSPKRTGTVKMAAVRPDELPHGPPSSGRMLDHHDFADGDGVVSFELEALPAGHVATETMAGTRLAPSPPSTPRSMPGAPPVSRPSREMRAVTGPASRPSREMLAVAASRSSQEMLAAPPSHGARPGAPLAPPPDAEVITRVIRHQVAVVATPPAFQRRPGIVAFAGFGIVPTRLTDAPAYALRVLARRRVLNAGLAVARAQRPQDIELYEAALATADASTMTKGIALIVAVILAGIAAVAAVIVYAL